VIETLEKDTGDARDTVSSSHTIYNDRQQIRRVANPREYIMDCAKSRSGGRGRGGDLRMQPCKSRQQHADLAKRFTWVCSTSVGEDG